MSCPTCGDPTEVTRLRTDLARAKAKHVQYAATTNQLLTELMAEVTHLRGLSETPTAKGATP